LGSYTSPGPRAQASIIAPTGERGIRPVTDAQRTEGYPRCRLGRLVDGRSTGPRPGEDEPVEQRHLTLSLAKPWVARNRTEVSPGGRFGNVPPNACYPTHLCPRDAGPGCRVVPVITSTQVPGTCARKLACWISVELFKAPGSVPRCPALPHNHSPPPPRGVKRFGEVVRPT